MQSLESYELPAQFGGGLSAGPGYGAVITALPSPAPARTILPAKTDMTTPVTHDDVLAAPASNYLNNSLSLEGGPNSPGVTPGANDPGLESNSLASKGFTMSATWKWIIGIVLALLALWYFFGKPSVATA